jgi:hypothetical protein
MGDGIGPAGRPSYPQTGERAALAEVVSVLPVLSVWLREQARAALAAIDREALAAVGFDARLDAPPLPDREAARAPRRPTVKAVLQGRLPLTPTAKAVLRDSSKEVRRGGRHPGPQRVLGELLRLQRPDPAAELFARLGIDAAAARERLPDA